MPKLSVTHADVEEAAVLSLGLAPGQMASFSHLFVSEKLRSQPSDWLRLISQSRLNSPYCMSMGCLQCISRACNFTKQCSYNLKTLHSDILNITYNCIIKKHRQGSCLYSSVRDGEERDTSTGV